MDRTAGPKLALIVTILCLVGSCTLGTPSDGWAKKNPAEAGPSAYKVTLPYKGLGDTRIKLITALRANLLGMGVALTKLRPHQSELGVAVEAALLLQYLRFPFHRTTPSESALRSQ